MLKQIFYAWRSVIHSPRQSVIKMVSLSFGIGVPVILFSWVAYFKSFDTSYYDHDRLYQLWMSWELTDRTIPPSSTIIGKLPEGAYEEMSDIIESAVSMRPLRTIKIRKDGKYIPMKVSVADSLFFETMGVDIVRGNPRKDLARPDVAFVSEDIVKTCYDGEDPVGKELWYESEFPIRIAGIFKSIPENNTVNPDIVLSLPSFWSRGWMHYSWNGGDSWNGYVRLKDGVKVPSEELDRRINGVIQRHAPDKDGSGIRGYVRPMRDTVQKDEDIQSTVVIFTALAVSILLISALNYVLVSIASLSRRAKAIGVHKCSGAQQGDILRMFVYETLIIIAGALLLFVLLLLQYGDFIKDTIGASLEILFAPERIYVALAVIAVVVIIGAVIPGVIMSHVSVTSVFRNFSENKKRWKRALLFVQFAGVAFIIGFLSVVWLSYDRFMTAGVGYNEDGLVMVPYPGEYDMEVYRNMLKNLPYVEGTVMSGSAPIYSYSGMMIRNNQGNDLFSSRFDCVDKDYFDFMGFELLSGVKEMHGGNEVIVNREFCNNMGWDVNDAVGKTFNSGNGVSTVVGVMENVVIRTLYRETMPLVLYSAEAWSKDANLMTLRLKAPFEQNFKQLKDAVATTFPNIADEPEAVIEIKAEMYGELKSLRNIALIAGVSIIFIAVMGLVGYITDEIQRRRKEIAIRKINGADVSSIIGMLISDIVKIAFPAVAIGGIAAYWIGVIFNDSTNSVGENIMAVCCLSSMVVFAVIVSAVILMTWRAANANPTENLRSE